MRTSRVVVPSLLFSMLVLAVCGYGQSGAAERPAVASGATPTWSGYVVPGGFAGTVTDVKGSWIVPTATCTLGIPTKSSFWVGMDGYDTKNGPEQIGTHSDCSILGYPVYYAFYEFVCGFLCGSEKTIPITISGGDTISAEVSYSNNLFTVTITDETTGKYFAKTKSFPNGQRRDAEWIAEDPLWADGIPYFLSNFGTALYGYDNTGQANTCYATINNVTGPLGSFAGVTALTMQNKDIVEAVPSSLSPDQSSFSVAWEGSILLSDDFAADSTLNSHLWTTSSQFLTNLAAASSSPPATFVPPQLGFSSQTGMQMTGPNQDYETTGVQSLSTFTPPFTVVTDVMATQGDADPFEIFLASSDLTQFLTVTANFSSAYDGMWATAPNISQLWQLGEQFTPSISPSDNLPYRITISVDRRGAARVTVADKGGTLGSVSNLQTGGTGPFYLVLGQRIGNAPPEGQVADWFYAAVY